MIEANRYKLGLFVLGGAAILLVILFFLGLSNIFEKKVKVASIFGESVQGLDIGSPVKFRGVPIGRVTKISLCVNDINIRVDMELYPSVFDVSNQLRTSADIKNFFGPYLQEEVDKGLRCQLAFAGITGLKYIELDYYEPAKFPVRDFSKSSRLAPDIYYLPARDSVFKDILRLLSESMEKIAKVPYEKIAQDIQDTLKSVTKTLEDPRIQDMISQLEKASKNLESTTSAFSRAVTEDKLNELITNVTDGMKAFSTAIKEVSTTIEKSNVPQTSEKFREAAESVTDIKRNFAEALVKFEQTLDSMTELLASLEDDPTALIKGKQKPELTDKLRLWRPAERVSPSSARPAADKE
jgi:phospholipid/cholesterol/gamma-HCH transport system substrate-binding protein/paraquat-inducible protein B